MPHGQCRLDGHDKNGPRQRLPPPRPLKDTPCFESRPRQCPVSPLGSPGERPQKREFAPSGKSQCPDSKLSAADHDPANRFSILANLDQSSNQTNWAFDFVQTSSNGGRRRGKRAGKNSRTKYTRQYPQEGGKSESERLEDLRAKMSTLSLGHEGPKTSAVQSFSNTRGNFISSTDVVRHPWMPQFRPNSLSTQSSPQTPPRTPPESPVKQKRFEFPQPPERSLTRTHVSPRRVEMPHVEMPEFKRRESRFFPLSAFLAAPDTATRHPIAPRVLSAVPAMQNTARKQLSIVIPSPAQMAAASAACRAIASEKALSPTLTAALEPHDSRLASPSPLAQTSIPITPPITPNSPSTTSPFTPMPITPSLTVSPTLTTSPTILSLPSLASSPSIVSIPQPMSPRPSHSPPPLPPRPLSSPATPSISYTWRPAPGPAPLSPTSPLSFVTTPVSPSLLKDRQSHTASPKPSPPIVATPALEKPHLSTPFALDERHTFPSPTFDILSCATDTIPPTINLLDDNSLPIPPSGDLLNSPTPNDTSAKSSLSSVVQKQLADFLKLGHANPCWCVDHRNWTFPPKPQPSPIVNLPPKAENEKNEQEDDKHEENGGRDDGTEGRLAGLRKRMREDSSESEKEEDELHNVSLTPSSTCSSRLSFEDLGFLSLDDKEEKMSDGEEEWTVVSPGERYGKPSSLPIAEAKRDEAEDGMSLDWDGESTDDTFPSRPSLPTEWTELVAQPSTPPKSDQEEMAENPWSAAAVATAWPTAFPPKCTSPKEEHAQQHCDQCLICDCPCTTSPSIPATPSSTPAEPSRPSTPVKEKVEANSSSIEWPTLQEAMGLHLTLHSRTRRERSRSSSIYTRSRAGSRASVRAREQARINTVERRRERKRKSRSRGSGGVGSEDEGRFWDRILDWW